MRQIAKYFILFIGRLLFKNNGSKVLYYHDLHSLKQYTKMSTSIDKFDNHINLINENGYNIVKDIKDKNGQIEICFDDGFKGVYDNKDFIITRNIFVKIFLVSDFIGKDGFMNEKEILELNNLDNFSFGSHTQTHATLGDLNETSIKTELLNSKNALEYLLGEKVDSLCFPKGIFSKKVLQISSNLGYTKLYSSIPGNYFRKSKKFNLINRCLVQHMSKRPFLNTLKGGQEVFRFRTIKQHLRN